MTAIDTNVLIDLEEGTQDVAERALAAVERAAEYGKVVVCGPVFAELCARAAGPPAEVLEALRTGQIAIDAHLSLEVWSAAGTAYGRYARRRRTSGSGVSRRILADFIIGAHAQTIGTLVTSDVEFFRKAFPDLRVVDVRG